MNRQALIEIIAAAIRGADEEEKRCAEIGPRVYAERLDDRERGARAAAEAEAARWDYGDF